MTQMVPRCMRINSRKLNQPVEDASGIRTDRMLWPRLGEGEREIGRWHAASVRLLIDQVPDPEWGAYVMGGSMGVLVTDRSIRGTIYEADGGKAAPLGQWGYRVTLYWPYELIDHVLLTSYRGSFRQHVVVEDPIQDGHLGMGEVTQPRGRRPDDFMSPIFSAKDRVEELYKQLFEAIQGFRG